MTATLTANTAVLSAATVIASAAITSVASTALMYAEIYNITSSLQCPFSND